MYENSEVKKEKNDKLHNIKIENSVYIKNKDQNTNNKLGKMLATNITRSNVLTFCESMKIGQWSIRNTDKAWVNSSQTINGF